MADDTIFIPAAELAAKNKTHFPNESPEYRQARNRLLSEEIDLRRHIEQVAAPFPPAVKSLKTMPSKASEAWLDSHSCSATRTHS